MPLSFVDDDKDDYVKSEDTGAVFKKTANAKAILEIISKHVDVVEQKPAISVEFIPDLGKEVLAVTCAEFDAWDSYTIIIPSDKEGDINANTYYMRCMYDYYKFTTDDYDLSTLESAMCGVLWEA